MVWLHWGSRSQFTRLCTRTPRGSPKPQKSKSLFVLLIYLPGMESLGRTWEKQSNSVTLLAPAASGRMSLAVSLPPLLGTQERAPLSPSRAPTSWAMNLALLAVRRFTESFPLGKPAGPGPSSDCLSTQPCSSGRAGSLVGMGRTWLGACRLAPANTFRKYGFLVNRVKKKNLLTNLPRVKGSPGECVPHCQDWLCRNECSRCVFPIYCSPHTCCKVHLRHHFLR